MTRYTEIIAKAKKGMLGEHFRYASDNIKPGPALDENLPDDYKDFIQNVGFGGIGKSRYSIYSGPADFDEIFGHGYEENNFQLIGDDFSGYCIGYRIENDGTHTFVEIGPSGDDIDELEESFSEYIIQMISDIIDDV